MLKQLRRDGLRDGELWVDHWQRHADLRFDREALRWDGFLDVVDALVERTPVLEAGCGPGRYLLHLWNRGIEAVGIDFAPEPLGEARRHAPVHVAAADVRALPFSDGTFGAVMCLGVLEHFEQGAAESLHELVRVVRPGGLVVITVPFANLVKRVQVLRGQSNVIRKSDSAPEGWSFYQYCYTRPELRRLLEDSGLSVVEERSLGKLFWFASFAQRGRHASTSHTEGNPDRPTGASQPLSRKLLKSFSFRAQRLMPGMVFAHMILAVGRKAPANPHNPALPARP